ncbi:MAG: crotonobetainyl-CoA--carnitine CoA-transferase [Rhodospirillaceae bacterium]|nr:crotonobetainyl-CoA--carnitine CoA-transferase [Rhodospirillales bacterium]
MVEAMHASVAERKNRVRLANMLRNTPIPNEELWANMGLFINRMELSRIFFINELYQHILPINGVVMEFGVRWGQNLSLFTTMRGMYEPFNRTRKIIGFDTFAGFPSVHDKDGDAKGVYEGAYSVSPNYEEYLADILDYQESECPIGHLKKYELCKGDAVATLEAYLAKHPETIISLAYFDFDIYEPTRKCLEMIKPHLTKGSVIGFDELNCPDYPGETLALREVFDMNRISIRRTAHSGYSSYFIVD